MHRDRSTPGLIKLATYIILIAAIAAAAFFVAPTVRATDEPIDLDENTANGEESQVSTKVVNTYPVEIENTIFNNAGGVSYNFVWDGAGPGGFDSFLTPGPDVGTLWLWSSVYQVYPIESPIIFTPRRSIPVFGNPSDGIDPVGSDNNGTFNVPGRSIFPNSVTLSDASLTSSWISFFSPEETRAVCGTDCSEGNCDLSLRNLTGGAAMMSVQQSDCCEEPDQTICADGCKSYLTDTANCGGCRIICGPDEVCSNGACMCPEGQTQCGDGCLNLSADPLNCGACGNACGIDEFCSGGACLCPAGRTQCGGGCFDLDNDDDNCGTCGNTCASDQFCGNGACACSDPSRTVCGGACVDTGSDDANCGACGNACAPDEFCGEGACQPICLGEVCGEDCIDPGSDPLNCGGCGNVCGPDEFCSDGACMCPAGRTQCGDGCLDLQNDSDNCGACGTACGSGQFCSAGACACSDPGQTLCGGVCIDTQDDPINCGACGNVCGVNNICSAGACSRCRPPTGTACGNACVNIHTDPINCGACGNVCDFSGCPSEGQGTCSQGSSCVCTDPESAGAPISYSPIASDPPGRLKKADSPTEAKSRKAETSNVIHSTPARRNATAPAIARSLAVVEAPVCDVLHFEQMIPDGETYVQSTGTGRIGKEVQVTVSIEGINGEMLAQGPCPVIVPVTDIDTSGVLLTASSVVTNDSSGDGLCQPTEDECNYTIELKNVGDSSCVNPLATLTSPPDQFNLNEIILLNSVSAYPTLPGYPGEGIVLEGRMNQTPFSVTTLADQAADVGRPFLVSVQCQNIQETVEMPIVLGFGSACTPGDIDGETYDHLNGLMPPVNAPLVPQGGPVNFSNGNFNHGSTVPLKIVFSCGDLVLTDAQIDPNPSIVALEHTVLGPLPLVGINGKNNANPNDPQFSCSDVLCDYQFRTEDLPNGTFIVSIKMPDSRVFQAGFTVKP